MRAILLFLFTCTLGQLAYSDDQTSYSDDQPSAASAQQDAVKAQLQQLVTLDRQIENLEQQKAQLKGQMAKHLERGSTGILPGVGRRQSREAGQEMQSIQALNQQIENLESQRQDVLRQLK